MKAGSGQVSRDLGTALDRARRGDEAALLAVTRHVAGRFESYGAYSVRDDWSRAVRDVVQRALSSDLAPDAAAQLDTLAKNRFWGAILDSMSDGNLRAGEVFFPAIRRLLASWDDGRRMMASWDDVVQETAQQLWERWRQGGVERPWALLRTIAKRRYLDRVRRVKPTDEVDALDREAPEEEDDGASSDLFAEQLLDVLPPDERQVILEMDLEGSTRVETARALGVSEGKVLSVRRSGLRRIWRRMGEDLPPDLREVWEEMFKGAKRPTPAQIAAKMGIPVEEVEARVAQARSLIGL